MLEGNSTMVDLVTRRGFTIIMMAQQANANQGIPFWPK